MIRIYYMKLSSDCSSEQSLALLYGEDKRILIPGKVEKLYECLPQERKVLVDRARNENVRRKRIYTGAFLQYVLADELGVSMYSLRYCYNQWGKPELEGHDLFFNLSHSGEYVVLAISDSPVGIDVEHKTKGYDVLAKRCFCPEEYEDIMSAGKEEERQHCFLEYWTKKEAYIKCLGEGMRIPLNSFSVQEGNYHTLWLDSGYCVSVCVG